MFFLFNILLTSLSIYSYKLLNLSIEKQSVTVFIPLRIIIVHKFYPTFTQCNHIIVNNNYGHDTYMFLLRPNRKPDINKLLKVSYIPQLFYSKYRAISFG